MNVFVIELCSSTLDCSDTSNEVRIEDNIGESIHIHHRDTRLEMSVDDFRTFANEIRKAKEELEDGNS